MPLQPTDSALEVFKGAKGIDDQSSIVKLDPGFASFVSNLEASSDVWKRRAGRDFSFLGSGNSLIVALLTWDDGTYTEIASFGSVVYDMTTAITYILNSGVKLIIQSADLNYWNVTPDANGLINPVVVAAPSATSQAANFTVANGESIAFKISATAATQILCDVDHGAWYLKGLGTTVGTTTYTTDLVFTVASGFSFRMKDYSSNTFKFVVSNDGNLTTITV